MSSMALLDQKPWPRRRVCLWLAATAAAAAAGAVVMTFHAPLGAPAALAAAPSVLLPCGGCITGAWEEGLAAFRGLRYGEAPLARRRWKPAAPAQCGAEVLATHDGPRCRQGGASDSEDCLNLNVFAPPSYLGNSSSRLPVIVWIYGGMNTVGSATSYGHIENLVRKRDCILVAMNYRLGIFGYLALKELSAVDPRGSSGNLGITDQQLALQWVQQNIRAFGGDPDRVTILGQSSGGTNVFALLASNASRGLFHRAIALSGSPNITMDRRTKEDQDRRLILPKTPCTSLEGAELLECLYELDAEVLDKALPESYQVFDSLYDYPTNRVGLSSRVSTLVHVDGHTVTFALEDALQEGLVDVPILFQSMAQELGCAPAPQLADISRQNFSHFLRDSFAVYGEGVAEEIDALYQHYEPPEKGGYAIDADTGAACGLRRLTQAAAKGFKSPVYWSTVTAGPSRPMPGQRFAFHNWDLTAAAEIFDDYEPSNEDLSLGRRLRADWFELAIFGTLREAEGWKKVQDSAPGQVIGSEVGELSNRWNADHKATECAFWTSIGVDQRWWWIN
ncbi:unnamed protein product [Effrenium voratum]|uniref:Carboxylic ester hydrolase n=1 Tax=Effrenium voratum TaxID=2562239 RepID=A0AA36I5B8_9DINO|nr:unnamed protein product [Effrenium voratum]